MAKIVSHVWSSARGSIAGITYLTTAAGQIIARQRTRPVNTPTYYRTLIKDSMISRAAQWNAITQVQREQWDVYAAANGMRSGRYAFLSGTMLAQYCYLTGLAGATVISIYDPRPETNFAPNCAVTTVLPTGALNIAVAVKVTNSGPQRALLLIEVSPNLNPARTYWKGPWDVSKTQVVALLSGVTTTYQMNGLSVGQRYFIRVRAQTNDTAVGLRGNRNQAPLIVNQLAQIGI